MSELSIDLGHNHTMQFTRWEPDDLPQNRATYGIPDGSPMPVVEKWGCTVTHLTKGGQLCEGCIQFDGEWQRKSHANYVEYCRKQGIDPPLPYVAWTVKSWEPLTIWPSLLCGRCGDHGHIKQGRWEPC